jgi:hypothetical protein
MSYTDSTFDQSSFPFQIKPSNDIEWLNIDLKG